MKHLKTLSSLASATGLSALLVTGMTGCAGNTEQHTEQPQAKKGAFVIIEETEKGKFKIKDEFPADETRIVLKKLNGTEQVLTQAELDTMIKEEEAKIDNGTSNLTNPQPQASGGMGLGETILASAAGAMLGAYIGNKLFGNQNYQNNRKAGYKSPSTYSKSNSSFNKSSTGASNSKKSGFFGGDKKTSSSSSSSKSSTSFGG